ncbi:MAG: Cof-type HAD-IIB family hydrolase [Clostridiales bacterium]|nr:Cof-type HAD-IIB family hydrolase [Clostridiales bacterium]
MPRIRLIAMDMDGTLLAGDGRTIPRDNVLALRRAADRGIHLALATGRLPDDAGFFASDAGLPMHILAINGSVRVDEPLGDVVSARFIPAASARAIARAIWECGLRFSISSVHEVAFSSMPEDIEAARRSQGTYLDRRGGRIRLSLDGSRIEELLDRVNKFSVISDDAERLARLKAMILSGIRNADVTSSWYDNLEIIPEGVNKGSAVKELAASLGIRMSEVMAIGDQDNDIPMIAEAGLGVAVGNASPAARAAADHVVGTNDECGVAQAIEALALS